MAVETLKVAGERYSILVDSLDNERRAIMAQTLKIHASREQSGHNPIKVNLWSRGHLGMRRSLKATEPRWESELNHVTV